MTSPDSAVTVLAVVPGRAVVALEEPAACPKCGRMTYLVVNTVQGTTCSGCAPARCRHGALLSEDCAACDSAPDLDAVDLKEDDR